MWCERVDWFAVVYCNSRKHWRDWRATSWNKRLRSVASRTERASLCTVFRWRRSSSTPTWRCWPVCCRRWLTMSAFHTVRYALWCRNWVKSNRSTTTGCHAGQQREVRHGLCVTRGSHSFTCHPHTDHSVCTPQSQGNCRLTGTKLYCLVTEAHRCK